MLCKNILLSNQFAKNILLRGKKKKVNWTNSPSEKIALARKIKKPEKPKGFLNF